MKVSELKELVNAIPEQYNSNRVDCSGLCDIPTTVNKFTYNVKHGTVFLSPNLSSEELKKLKRRQEIERLCACWQGDVIENLKVTKDVFYDKENK